MIEQVHKHILEELKINAKADTGYILVSVALNLITLIINSAISSTDKSSMITMLIFIILTAGLSIAAEIGLIKGRKASSKLIKGLVKMYNDNNVGSYYDVSLLDHYKSRYNLFMLIIFGTALVAIVVPIINIS